LPSPFGKTSTALPPTRRHHEDVNLPRSEPAIRSPDGTSLEVPRPFSAISHASPLSRCWSRQVAAGNGRGIASPAAFPPSGFLSLRTAFSSHVLVGLFHPTGTLGVSYPPELFPLPQPRCLSAALALLSFAGIRCKHRLPPAFRALLRVRIRWLPPMSPPSVQPRCSPGLLPLQGFHPSRRGVDFATPPLPDFAAARYW